MNKEQLRRSLTWEYFWKRKGQEIWDVKGSILGIQIVIFILMAIVFAASPPETPAISYSLGIIFLFVAL